MYFRFLNLSPKAKLLDLKNSTTSTLVISSLELWISGKIQFTVRSLRFLKILKRPVGPLPSSSSSSIPLLPCSASAPLLPAIGAAHRRARSSPAPPPAAFASTCRPQPKHRPSSSSLALSRACHATRGSTVRHLTTAAATCAQPLAPSFLAQELHQLLLFPFHSLFGSPLVPSL
jgi:hypothetical protein